MLDTGNFYNPRTNKPQYIETNVTKHYLFIVRAVHIVNRAKKNTVSCVISAQVSRSRACESLRWWFSPIAEQYAIVILAGNASADDIESQQQQHSVDDDSGCSSNVTTATLQKGLALRE